MLEELAEVIENLDIPPSWDGLTRALAQRDRLEARIAEAVEIDCGIGPTELANLVDRQYDPMLWAHDR